MRGRVDRAATVEEVENARQAMLRWEEEGRVKRLADALRKVEEQKVYFQTHSILDWVVELDNRGWRR